MFYDVLGGKIAVFEKVCTVYRKKSHSTRSVWTRLNNSISKAKTYIPQLSHDGTI